MIQELDIALKENLSKISNIIFIGGTKEISMCYFDFSLVRNSSLQNFIFKYEKSIFFLSTIF